uniref:Calmodulin binding transcription activator 2 n=1 Tax=Scleropages formosus TaxID=113540 RepID=A0A8C9WG28_SCLFO
MNNKETTTESDSSSQMKVFLPNKLLECLPRPSALPKERLRWNTNEEIASYLISFDRHEEWLSCSLKTRPVNGSVILYNRKKVKYRKDGYCWKKRKDGKTTREDHMKLKVQGMEVSCLYGCYVHSSIVPTFHRRCYWLLQNPDIVLVHYLNVPSLEDCGKVSRPLLCAVAERRDSLRWTREELLSQLKPMFHSIKWSCSNGNANGTSEFSIEQLVQHIMDSQQTKPQPRTHACLCSTALEDSKRELSFNRVNPASPRLSVGPSSCLVLSPVPPNSETPPPPASTPCTSISVTNSRPHSSSTPTPGVATLSLTLLPSPVIGGLLLTDRLLPGSDSSAPLSLLSPHPPSPAPSPLPAAPQPLPPCSSSPPPSAPTLETPPAFDPDSFLNSPKQGQTYGGLGDGGSNAGKSALGDLSVNSRSTPAGAEQSNPFVISFDSQFPDLISELIAEDCQTNQTEGTAPELQAHPVPFPFPSPSQSHSEHLASEGHYIMPPQSTSVSSSLSFPDFTTSITSQGQSSDPGTEQRPLATITDFSPEWSYPEGGVKVLITGPWTQTAGRYSCVFDRSTVPASLIQPGVLRCYCPAHAAGLVTLRVLEDTGLASSSVLFEYRPRCASSLPSSQLDWLSLDDNQFRMSILERLEQMEKRMAEMAASDSQRQQVARSVPGTEERVQAPQVCSQPTDSGERLLHSTRHRGMTLLHLAAAQGYTQLIHTLIHWRTVNPGSLDLEQEVDPLNVDHFSCTPLMWACALGHHKAAVLLFHWNSLALDIPDSLGRLPLGVARSRGHTRLALCLEELRAHCALPEEEFNPGQTTPLPPPPSPLSTSPDTGLNQQVLYPMDTSAPSLSTSSPPPSPPLSLPPWDEAFGEAGQPRDPTLPMEFESAGSLPGTPHSQRSDFEAELLGFGEDSENQEYLPAVEEIQVDMVTLAEQIIEATPERIKQEEFPRSADSPLRERRDNPAIQSTMPWLATYLDTPMPLAPTCRSPRSPRPPSSSASWAEFLGAAGSGRVERDFALLTLSDIEQRELYEAARVIQNAFRRYKGRRLKEQQDMAAAVIQRCYRKYKQLTWIALKYALYKKMTQAAILIQSKFRSYYEQKKFQQSRRAAVLIQQYYRSYKEYERLKQNHRGPTAGSFLTKKQDQAARKIMRFLRRCRHRIKELKQSRELESLQARNLAS